MEGRETIASGLSGEMAALLAQRPGAEYLRADLQVHTPLDAAFEPRPEPAEPAERQELAVRYLTKAKERGIDLLDAAQSLLERVGGKVADGADSLLGELREAQSELDRLRAEWQRRREERQADFDAALRELQDKVPDVDPERYLEVERRIERLTPLRGALDGLRARHPRAVRRAPCRLQDQDPVGGAAWAGRTRVLLAGGVRLRCPGTQLGGPLRDAGRTGRQPRAGTRRGGAARAGAGRAAGPGSRRARCRRGRGRTRLPKARQPQPRPEEHRDPVARDAGERGPAAGRPA